MSVRVPGRRPSYHLALLIVAIVTMIFAGRGTLRAAGSGATQQDAGLSCKAILAAGLSTGDGVYWIDPNGGDHADAFQAYCDMTTDGGGWTLAVNSFTGNEPSTTDMTSNTGVVAFFRGHTRDLTNLAINNEAQIRYVLSDFGTPGRSFHAKFTGRYHNPLPLFSAWTPLAGHTPGAESMMSSHFGMNWSTPLSDRDTSSAACSSLYGNVPWHYNNCWTSIPTNQADGSTQGPRTNGGSLTLFRFSIFVREVATIVTPPAHVAPSFGAAVNLPVGTGPVDAAIGDFDNDGTSDIVTADSGVTVTVRYANGTVFQQRGLDRVQSIAAGDFNADNQLDFVVGYAGFGIETFLNTGDGFVHGSAHLICQASNIVAADFDKDGVTDVALACSNDGSVVVAKGDPGGSLLEVKWLLTNTSTHSLAQADFNGDTWMDIVVTGGSTGCFNVFLGGPGFSFTPNLQCSSTFMGPVSVGDLDGDGRLDLAVGATTQVNSLRNIDGVHFSTMALSVVDSVVDLALADVDANGTLDLVVAHSAPSVGIALGGPNGAFTLAEFGYAVSSVPRSVTVGDLNGDARPDIVTTDTATDSVSVLYNSFGSNLPPTALGGTLTVIEGTSESGTLTGTDPESAALTFALTSTGTKGTASLSDASTGAYSYVANAGETGTDAFTFTVSDGRYTSPAATIIVTITPKRTPQITWSTPAAIVYGTPLGAAQLNAAVQGGVTGTFSYAPAVGTVLGAGPAQLLTVNFTPDDTARYTTSSATVSIDVLQKPLAVKTADASIVFGQPVPAFSVTYSGFVNGDSPASLGGTLAFTGPSLTSAGNYPITPGGLTSPNYAIQFQAGTFTIAPAVTSTDLVASAAMVGVLQPVKLTATVGVNAPGMGSPGGPVQFFDGAIPIGSAWAVDGIATLTVNGMASGGHTFSAAFTGGANFVSSNSAGTPVTVRSVSQSSFTFAFSTNSPSAWGQPATLGAVVIALAGGVTPTGSVAFLDGATLLGTAPLAGGVAQLSTTAVRAGPHVFVAVYLGNATLASSVSAPAVHTVFDGWQPLAASMTLAPSATPTALGDPVTFTATVMPANELPPGTVIFLVDNTLLASAGTSNVGGLLQAQVTTRDLSAGVHVVSAIYTGNGVFAAAAAGPILHVVQ